MTPNLVCQPSRASILTGLLPLSHGVWDNGVDLNPQVGEAGFAGTLAAHDYHTAFIGKAHFSTKSTFQPTGTPECRYSGATYGPDWCGPYMGFQHAELAVAGHLHRTRPLEHPVVGHYERWLLSRLPDDRSYTLWGSIAWPRRGSSTDLVLVPPRSLAFQHLDCRARHCLLDRARPASAFLPVGVVSRSASSLRLPGALEPPV